jgi:hypothetical protein
MRTLSGEVSYYDPDPGHYVALPEAVVEIPTLGLRAVADRWGKFAFRDLPSGTYTFSVAGVHLSLSREVSIPSEPVDLHETFRIAPQKE